MRRFRPLSQSQTLIPISDHNLRPQSQYQTPISISDPNLNLRPKSQSCTTILISDHNLNLRPQSQFQNPISISDPNLNLRPQSQSQTQISISDPNLRPQSQSETSISISDPARRWIKKFVNVITLHLPMVDKRPFFVCWIPPLELRRKKLLAAYLQRSAIVQWSVSTHWTRLVFSFWDVLITHSPTECQTNLTFSKLMWFVKSNPPA